MFPAMTASNNSLYIIVPAPPMATTASVSGTARIALRSSRDEAVTFSPRGTKVSGGSCLIEGSIDPASAFSNTCMSGWLADGDMRLSFGV